MSVFVWNNERILFQIIIESYLCRQKMTYVHEENNVEKCKYFLAVVIVSQQTVLSS